MYFEEGHVIRPFLQEVCLKLHRLINFFDARRMLFRNYAMRRATLCFRATHCFRRLRVGPLRSDELSPTISLLRLPSPTANKRQ